MFTKLESTMKIKMLDMMAHTPVPGGLQILQKKRKAYLFPFIS